jgi:hypothetical protein
MIVPDQRIREEEPTVNPQPHSQIVVNKEGKAGHLLSLLCSLGDITVLVDPISNPATGHRPKARSRTAHVSKLVSAVLAQRIFLPFHV